MAFTGTWQTDMAPAAGRVRTGYVAQLERDYRVVEAVWERMAAEGAALPFQRANWLAQWYSAHPASECQPVLVTVTDTGTGQPVLALPLMRYRDGPLRVIACADAGLTDYNAPILGAGVPQTLAGAQAILRAIRTILPPADVLYLGKMPERVGALANPLALLPGAEPASLGGNILVVPGAWDDWHFGLERTFRKELERSLRVFHKTPGARFLEVTGEAEVARVFAALKSQQRGRIHDLRLPYVLDEPVNEAFYDRLLGEGLRDGSAILTALMVEDEVVAALLGIRDGQHYAMVRLSTGGAKWKNCSPGRLLIERTMHMLHGEGYRKFDFTIGDYSYKRRMGVAAVPLRELRLPLSWRGVPLVVKEKLKSAIRARPGLRGMAKRVREVVRMGVSVRP